MSHQSNTDPVLHSIDTVIDMIEKDQSNSENIPKILSREEILNNHLEYLKNYLLQ